MASDSYCSLGLAKIISANSYTRIYEVLPLFKPQQSMSNVIRAVSIGSLGNTKEGAQVSPAYSPGDCVLIVYQENVAVVDRLRVAYILGIAPYEIFVGTKPEDWVRSGRLGFANINPLNFAGLDLLEATTKPDRLLQTHTGHGTADLLPGTWEVAGKLVSLQVPRYCGSSSGHLGSSRKTGISTGRGFSGGISCARRRVMDRSASSENSRAVFTALCLYHQLRFRSFADQ